MNVNPGVVDSLTKLEPFGPPTFLLPRHPRTAREKTPSQPRPSWSKSAKDFKLSQAVVTHVTSYALLCLPRVNCLCRETTVFVHVSVVVEELTQWPNLYSYPDTGRVLKDGHHTALGTDGSSPNGTGAKSKIFPGKKSEYYSKARELCSTITTLRGYLVDNRSAYLNFGSGPLTRNAGVWKSNEEEKLTDAQRDRIDGDVQKIVQNCQKKIFEFQRRVDSGDMSSTCPQLHSHLENVLNSLADYLKEVCTIHSEMRAVRVKRTIDYQTMSRLASHAVHSPIPKSKLKSGSSTLIRDNTDEMDSALQSTSVPAFFEEEISPEEMQIFEAENAQLLNELNSMAEEVDQIESSVVQIAQLQEIFTEKVLEQEKDIGKISNLVVGATENIRGGNEQIRQAIQKNADFRAWVLFFIIVMSFSLLFLDWYNE
ncbi:unnamed protein product [Allacma fusca]|uniref:Syntaxin-18 n=1 Tax=Allacma fusca TaxID=39272 RepID=A0A8J2KGL3_9HEXA|nr:unnamed protein product [Allacma fusca]